MRTHQVEVDEEVFSYVKGYAEPLVDSFNSALRRLLLPGEAKAPVRPTAVKPRPTNGNSAVLNLPTGTPQALRQILEVVHLVRSGAYTRTAATQFVAKHRGVFPQTVLDKYGRQLQLTTSEFDRMLETKDGTELRKILKSKFAGHAEAIDIVFS